MRLQRQVQIAVVVDHMLADRHGRQGKIRLAGDIAMGGGIEERQAVARLPAAEAARRPQRIAPVETQRAEGIAIGQPLYLPAGEAGPQPQVAHRIVAAAPRRHQRPGVVLAETLDLAQAQADGMGGADLARPVGQGRMRVVSRNRRSGTTFSLP